MHRGLANLAQIHNEPPPGKIIPTSVQVALLNVRFALGDCKGSGTDALTACFRATGKPDLFTSFRGSLARIFLAVG